MSSTSTGFSFSWNAAKAPESEVDPTPEGNGPVLVLAAATALCTEMFSLYLQGRSQHLYTIAQTLAAEEDFASGAAKRHPSPVFPPSTLFANLMRSCPYEFLS